MTRDLRQTVREVLEEPGAYIGGRERAILADAIAHESADERCEHGHPAAIASRVVLGRGCALCLAGVVETMGGGSDAVWWGRQIERQAQRATEAIARAQRAEEDRAGLAARLEHFEGVGQNLARALEEVARTRHEADELAREADELTKRANEAIPFGPDAVDEPTIAAWRDRARVLIEIRDRLLKAQG